MQHEGNNCYLSFAVMILEHHKEENRPAWSWSPIFPGVLVASPLEWVIQGCRSAGFSAPEPSENNPAEICSASHGKVVLTVGAAAPAPVKTSKPLECFYWEELHQDHKTSWGIPGLSFPSSWGQQSPHFLLWSLALEGDGWSWPILS